MKKLVLIFSLVLLLGIPLSTSEKVSAKDSGGINLDPYITESNKGSIGENPEDISLLSRGNGPDGGGYHSVVWGGDRHTSKYQHHTKTHRASASNHRGTTRSAWKSKGNLASAWSYSSLWGNKANWATR